MSRAIIATLGARRVVLVDSITEVAVEDDGQIVVSGSHGGASAGAYAIRVRLALCCFNDAGVGKDRAGVIALDMLSHLGVPAVAVGHGTARIGDARDAWDHGVITHANQAALALSLAVGAALQADVTRIFGDNAR